MIVREHVALTVADLPVPDVHAIRIESESCQVIDIGVDGLLDRNAETLVSAKCVREGRRVIHAEECHLLPGSAPAHHTLSIDVGGRRSLGGERPTAARKQHQRADNGSHAATTGRRAG